MEGATTESNDKGRSLDERLELLWGTRDRASRGPKPRLTLEEIVRAGIAIADAEGLEAVSMRAVAERLGFTTMSLYRYLSSKADLVTIMVETAVGDGLPPSDQSGDWREQLTRWAHSNRAVFRRHPWLLRAATPGLMTGPNRIAWIESGLQALAGTELEAHARLEIVLALYAYVFGTAQLALDWTIEEGEDWTTVDPLMQRILASDRFPAMQEAIRAGIFDAPEEAQDLDPYDVQSFDFGLARLLDGIESVINRR